MHCVCHGGKAVDAQQQSHLVLTYRDGLHSFVESKYSNPKPFMLWLVSKMEGKAYEAMIITS